MTTDQLIKRIKALPNKRRGELLSRLFSDREIMEDVERLGYLFLTEKSFRFWNDPREDIYQDYMPRPR